MLSKPSSTASASSRPPARSAGPLGLALLLLATAGARSGEAPPGLRVGQGARVGFISAHGELIAPPIYEGCGRASSNGLVWVIAERSDAFSGNFFELAARRELLPRRVGQYFDEVMGRIPAFAHGRALVQLAPGRFGVANRAGHILLDAPGWAMLDRVGEAIPFGRDGRYGFATLDENVVVPPAYSDVRPFQGDVAAVKTAAGWRFIDRVGARLPGPAFELAERVPHGSGWIVRRNGKLGIVGDAGSLLVPAVYDDIAQVTRERAVVRQGDGWGIAALRAGGSNVAPDYQSIACLGRAACGAKRDGRWGLIDYAGRELRPFEFTRIEVLSETNDLWLVSRSADTLGLVGIVNASAGGKQLLSCEYDELRMAGNDIVLVLVGGRWGAVRVDDRGPHVLLAAEYTHIVAMAGFEGRLLAVCRDGRWGVASTANGRLIIACDCDHVDPWHGRVAARKGAGVALYDTGGAVVLPEGAGVLALPEPDAMTNGFGRVVSTKGVGLIDATGAIRLPCVYEDVGAWSEGRVGAKRDGRWGVADLEGRWLVSPAYAAIGPYSEGVAAVCRDGALGYIDVDGLEVVACRHAAAGSAFNGLMPVARRDADGAAKWGLIDRSGRTVLPLEYDALEWPAPGGATTRIYGRVGWVDLR